MNASLSQKEPRMMRNVIKDATKCRETIHLSRSLIYRQLLLSGVLLSHIDAVVSTKDQIRRSHCEMARSCWELCRYGTFLNYREAGASDAIRDCRGTHNLAG